MDMIKKAFNLGFLKESQIGEYRGVEQHGDILDKMPYGEDIKETAERIEDYKDYEFDGGEIALDPDTDEPGIEGNIDLFGGNLEFDASQNIDNDEFKANAEWSLRF